MGKDEVLQKWFVFTKFYWQQDAHESIAVILLLATGLKR